MISVVIPAYNEEENIGDVLSDVTLTMNCLGAPYEIIVVDDGSKDNTRHVASNYKATVLSNSRNRGKGYALRRGFMQAQGDMVVTIDADGSHQPKEIPDMLYPLYNGTDIVTGSRFLGKGRSICTSRINRVGNFLFNFTILVLTRKRITDSQTGFRAYKKLVLQSINLESTGYEIDTELAVKGLKNGFKVQEKPVYCQVRANGSSKLRILFDGINILKTILKANFSQAYTTSKK